MKRFTYFLICFGGIFTLAGMITSFLPFDFLSLENFLTSDGKLDSLPKYAFSGIEDGLIIGGIVLLLLALLFILFERDILRLFRLSPNRYVALIIGLQVIFAILYIINVDYIPDRDFEWYHLQATNLAAGAGVVSPAGEPTAYWPIGYPLLLSPLYRIFGVHVLVAQLFNIILICLITLFTFLSVRNFFDDKTARRSILVLIFLPSLTFYSIIPMADMPFALFVIMILYFATLKRALLNTIVIGVIFGCAVLTRPIVALFPIFLGIHFLLRGWNWKATLLHILLIMCIGEVMLLPWQIRNYNVFNEFIPFSTNGGIQLWMGNNSNASGSYIGTEAYITAEEREWMKSLTESQRDRFAQGKGIAWVKERPFRAILIWPKKVLHLYYKDSKCITYGLYATYDRFSPAVLSAMIVVTEGYYYSLLLSFLTAIVILIKREKMSSRVWWIAGTVLYFTGIHLPFVTEGRYHLPLIPLFALGAVLSFNESRRITPAKIKIEKEDQLEEAIEVES